MLIKKIIKTGPQRGTPVAHTPEEAAPFAFERAIKGMNSSVKIYWVLRKSIKISNVRTHNGASGSYEAWAEGTASVGYTDAKTDRFYQAKPHAFKVHYKSSTDSRGIPDITIVDSTIELASTNPQDHAPKVAVGVLAPAAEVLPKGVKIRKQVEKT